MMSEIIREELVKSCRDYIAGKVIVLNTAMQGLSEDLENESKSSAGDKYETGREMINIEWNKLSTQLNEFKRLNTVLDRLEKQSNGAIVSMGSVVKTDQANYFISIPAGLIKIDGEDYYAIGIHSPIAQGLLGRKPGQQFEFRGQKILIQDVL